MSVVLVTGVSGFVGSHVAIQLMESGYRVRGTARGAKVNQLNESLGSKYPALEIVKVDDVANADLTDVLEGVSAIIHVASPLSASPASPREKLTTALGGSLNVLRQAAKLGINKVVLTASWGTTIDPSMKQAFDGSVATEQDWGHVTEEEFFAGEHDAMWVYLASKILAEKAAWEFAEQNPTLDLSTINPPFIYGPYAPHFPVPDAGSNRIMYALLAGRVPPPFPPVYCDVRDVARAHVIALKLPAQTPVQNKRILVSGGSMIWKDVAQHLAESRPELRVRLPPLEKFGPIPPDGKLVSTIDVTRAQDLLGMKSWIDWKTTANDTINSFLEVERVQKMGSVSPDTRNKI